MAEMYDRSLNVPPGRVMTRQGIIERTTKWVQDLGRTIDYLETRDDMDTTRLALLGSSWGGGTGPIMAAVEERIKVMVLLNGGFFTQYSQPEVDQVTFAPQVTIPVLMLNGRYDHVFAVEESQIPMLQLFGTAEEDKRHVLFDSGHNVPRNEMIKEVLDWLDRYLGPVEQEF